MSGLRLPPKLMDDVIYEQNGPCNDLNLEKGHGYSYFLIPGKKLRKQLVLKPPDAQISSIWWLLTQFFGRQGRQEGYGMKMEDFQLHVHLLPCSLISNSNVALALFTLALKLKISHCQSRPIKP